MEIDLEQHEARAEPIRSQVCIVGAGIAGLTLAHRLSQQGIDVALLEAGGRMLDEPDSRAPGSNLYAQAQLTGEPHVGTIEGRFRFFGGSSVGWGGQLLPLPSSGDSAWPVSADELAPFTAAAERLLGVDELPYNGHEFFRGSGAAMPSLFNRLPEISATISKWTPFARRNLAVTLGRGVLASANVRVYLHAQAIELLLAATRNRLDAVLVRTLGGSTLRIEADHFVVAAGTVETSRLMLASRSVAPEGVGNTYDQVGRNFHDHITVRAATLTGSARSTLLRELRPWAFVRGGYGLTLHSAKLEASPELRRRHALNPVLAHIAIEEPVDSGVSTLRDFFVARQQGDIRSSLVGNAGRIPDAAIDALRLAWWAKFHHRRFVSSRAAVTLNLNAAQDTPSFSRISLSDKFDPFGLLQARVDWRITPHEVATLRSFAAHMRARFDALDFDGFHWFPELVSPDAPLPQIEDARHAMGGASMGADPRSSVVSPVLNVHGVENLHVASAAVFPTGAPPLPTLPLMALCLRLAERIAARLP